MNIYIMLGVACSNPEFADLLFSDPAAAAEALNLTLSPTECEQLNTMVEVGRGNGAPMAMADLRVKICPPSGVCPWISIQPQCSGQGTAAD